MICSTCWCKPCICECEEDPCEDTSCKTGPRGPKGLIGPTGPTGPAPFTFITSFSELVAANDTAILDAVLKQSITMTASITLTIPLFVMEGGEIITNGFNLIINEPFHAGLYQVFDAASGEIVFGNRSITEAYPQWFGAIADDSIDCTDAINKAIVSVESQDSVGAVFFASGTYKTTAPIVILTNRMNLIGHSQLARIYNYSTTTDTVQIGDGILELVNVRITNMWITAAEDSTGWAINIRDAKNTTIDHCRVTGGGVSSGGINLSRSWCSRVFNCVVSLIKGTAIKVGNDSHAVSIMGNRIDGYQNVVTPYGQCGIYFSAVQIVIHGNTVEGFLDCIILDGARAVQISSYFEEYHQYCIKGLNNCFGISITGCYFSATDAGAVAAINLPNTNGLSVNGNYSVSVHTGGSFARVTAPYPDAKYSFLANSYVDAAEVITI